MRVNRFNETKVDKSKKSDDITSFEVKDMVSGEEPGFRSELEEMPKGAEKKLKKEIQVTTPGLKKSIKKFEDFSIEIEISNGDNEYVGCGCCPECTGLEDCNCCSECQCSVSSELCDVCDCEPCRCGGDVKQTTDDSIIPFGEFFFQRT